MTESDKQETPKTPLVLLWAFTTLFWSIFTHPSRTFAARVVLFQPSWVVRAFITGDSTWTQDLVLFLGLHAVYGWWAGAWKLMTPYEVLNWLDFNNANMQIYLHVFTMLGGCAILAGTIVYRGSLFDSDEQAEPLREQRIDESLLDPLLITSRTSHSRLFPQKHTFSYSYLFVGIPVGFRGRIGNVLSIDSPRTAWFDVQSADYLSRGGVFLGFGEKLKRFLHSKGITDRDYAFAYLVTAPRFLGYSFNPVSFWYIYDSDVKLRYMILEVNNTFDERRMYLLKSDTRKSDSELGASIESTDGPSQDSKSFVFSDTFDKDFHVSPFNSRKGSYSLRAIDPFAVFQETGHAKIDNTIVLRSSADSPKIVARVWSEGIPKKPTEVSTVDLLKFIIAWWWVGLLTFPRICWEAQKLFFQKKLHVWFRPEVSKNSIGRTYTDDERILESYFHDFLTHVVEHARKPLRVIYESAHNQSEEVVLYSPGFTYEEDKSRTVTLKVLSPAFYSRFVHYAHAKEAFDRECLATDEKNRTIIVESPDVLPVLFDVMQDSERNTTDKRRGPSLLERMRWTLLRKLRCPPAKASYHNESSHVDHEHTARDIRSFQLSELDKYVQAHREDRDEYRRVVVKLFVAEQLLFGIPPLVALCDLVLRSVLVLMAMIYCDNVRLFDVLRPRPFKNADVAPGSVALLLANSVHIWSFLKG